MTGAYKDSRTVTQELSSEVTTNHLAVQGRRDCSGSIQTVYDMKFGLVCRTPRSQAKEDDFYLLGGDVGALRLSSAGLSVTRRNTIRFPSPDSFSLLSKECA